mgnify:CR=1 FL=1
MRCSLYFGLVVAAFGALLLVLERQFVAGVDGAGVLQESLALPFGFALLFFGTVIVLGDGARRMIRRALA